MPTYHVDLLNAKGRFEAVITIFCSDDSEAIAWVREMLVQRRDYPVAKVWVGSRFVAEIA
jgi:hypothetical protein